jgi:uncharacterized protein
MPAPLTDADIERIQTLLDALPAPLQPLDVVALDGYLCGVLLQPDPVPEVDWWPGVLDIEGQPPASGPDTAELAALVRRRHAELDTAIGRRDWFDPWIFALDEDSPPSQAVLPWVAGFSAAQDRFPGLTSIDDRELLEPLALLYLHVDRDDLEDADDLLPLIEEIEPPPDLTEAVQDMVRAVMLIADVSRPRARIPTPARPSRTARPSTPQRPTPRPPRKEPRR